MLSREFLNSQPKTSVYVQPAVQVGRHPPILPNSAAESEAIVQPASASILKPWDFDAMGFSEVPDFFRGREFEFEEIQPSRRFGSPPAIGMMSICVRWGREATTPMPRAWGGNPAKTRYFK